MSTVEPKLSVRRKLGRGLGSLISTPARVDLPPTAGPPLKPAPAEHLPAAGSSVPASMAPAMTVAQSHDHPEIESGLHNLALACITPNARQPRQRFDEAALESLAQSIRVSGVMQPVVVRPSAQRDGFEIIAGERRWRAAQRAGLTTIPALVRDVDDRTAAEFALVENLQREDLNPIERAESFSRLMREFHLTQVEVAERVGLDRSSVSYHLRLLELDGPTLDAVRDGRLSMGHAKALLAITNISARSSLAAEAVRLDWSVRELERRAREALSPSGQASAKGGGGASGIGANSNADAHNIPSALSTHLSNLQKRLGEHLGTKVQVHTGRTKGAGKLIIDFFSIDQFEGILRRLDFEMDE